MSISVKTAGTWTLVKSVYVKQAGVWVPVQKVMERNAGVWTQVYAAEVVVTITANTNSIILQNLFSPSDWTDLKRKRIEIAPGVIVGSTSSGVAAIRTGTGGVGEIVLNNAGSIHGAGGAANSGAGGAAIFVQQAGITINNSGAIRGGGGGGGFGGTGGPGYYYYTATEGPYYNRTGGGPTYWFGDNIPGGPHFAVWASQSLPGADWSFDYGGYHYFSGTQMENNVGGSNDYYQISRSWTATAYTSGGGGGNGGRGQGSDGALAAGSAGAAGGANAGTGGTGGTGGNWGLPGGTGATGGGGNNGGGSAGAAGGAAGAAIIGSARTLNNTGTINGAT